MAEHAKAKSKDQPLFLYLPYQAVHVGNKVTPSHPEYGMNQAPLRYIEPYLEVDTGTGPCGNKPPGKEGDMCPLAVAQRRNLSGMVRERERKDVFSRANFYPKARTFTKTGSGHTHRENSKTRTRFLLPAGGGAGRGGR